MRYGPLALVISGVVALSITPRSAQALPAEEGIAGFVDFQDEVAGAGDLDVRSGTVAPTPEQQQAAEDLGARARWTRFGTPAVLTPEGGALGSGLAGDAPTVARTWLRDHRDLFRLSSSGVDSLDLLLDVPIGTGRAVTFRQRFGGLPAASDGLVTFAVAGDTIRYLSSSLSADAKVDPTTLSTQEAYTAAAAGTGRRVRAAEVRATGQQAGWTRLRVTGLAQPQYTRLAALPTPDNGVRAVYDNVVFDDPVAARVLVDGITGQVLVRDNLVEHYDEPDPEWSVFPATPPLDYSTRDTRQAWCWVRAAGCDRVLEAGAAGEPWDIDPGTGAPSATSIGTNARSAENWNSATPSTVGTVHASPAPDRQYSYPWTNQWREAGCDPAAFTSPGRNDIDAAIANLFAQHNRMHDWAYHLGFTEQTFNLQGNDPEQGNAQAGGIAGGPPNPPSARNNANQITPPDGIAPITNMYLWQPLAGSFYAPCVDGDYDQTVIGHEYTHAITNRMIAGPDAGYSGPQGGAMGESWSDLFAMEYLNEYGLAPDPRSPSSIGAYVTGDRDGAIRNYAMDDSPLNYSDIAYDLVGQQVHADGEIWSAANFALREALVRKYNSRFPVSNRRLQASCADGKRPADQCPGNRRWIQLHFDSLLLMQSAVSYVDARDAVLAADQLRFGGANTTEIWNVFASRGIGEGATSNTNADADPVPDFTSPRSAEGTVVLQASARLFVGDYEARAVPVPNTVRMVPGRYAFTIQAPGYGSKRLTAEVRAGRTTRLHAELPRNLASASNGAVASGDGINHPNLIDDTEATNWASLGTPVAGRTVTVALDPSQPWHRISRIQVSAMLRPQQMADPGGDTGVQNRFSALRQFQLWTCLRDCAQDANFRLAYTSPADAFPAIAPRPRAPQLTNRSFDIPDVRASVVRIRVLTNQCTGAPDYAGEQDNDPNNATDCATASPQANNVRIAELQVYG